MTRNLQRILSRVGMRCPENADNHLIEGLHASRHRGSIVAPNIGFPCWQTFLTRSVKHRAIVQSVARRVREPAFLQGDYPVREFKASAAAHPYNGNCPRARNCRRGAYYVVRKKLVHKNICVRRNHRNRRNRPRI